LQDPGVAEWLIAAAAAAKKHESIGSRIVGRTGFTASSRSATGCQGLPSRTSLPVGIRKNPHVGCRLLRRLDYTAENDQPSVKRIVDGYVFSSFDRRVR
jgi:hypothetical protein